MRLLATAVAFCALTACEVATDKGEESELPDDGKFDSFRKPTDHGAIAFDMPQASELTRDERYHTWTFELSGEAKVDLTTSYALRGQRRTDTVLYLYRQKDDGSWGAYIARNDDYGDTTYSQLIRTLGAGHYRALVKGYDGSTRGKFKLTVGCEGDGCTAAPAPCLFGTTYGEALESLPVLASQKIHPADLATLDGKIQDFIVRAVRESAWNDVTTPEEAISHTDDREINLTVMDDTSGHRTFMALEFGAGDNSYGAIFDRDSGERVTAIHDGDLYDCSVQAETCLLPPSELDLRNGTAAGFTATSERTAFTSASQLAAAETAQALDALHELDPAIATVEAGLAMVDEGTLYFSTYHHTSGADIVVVSYYAGDTLVGRIYQGHGTTRVGTISDLEIVGCGLFQ